MKSDRKLSVEEKITIKRMHKNRRTLKYIANALNKSIKEITDYIHNQMKKEKPVTFSKNKYTPTGNDLPPKYTSPCKTIRVDKIIIENDLKQFGNKLEPIKMPLSEAPKLYNMRGVIIGTSFYRGRSAVI